MFSPSLQLTFVLATFVYCQTSGTVPCTSHDYEGDFQKYGIQLDNNPPYCGQRYSVLNVARIVATSFMEPSMCNQCVQIFGSGGNSVYVLAVDRRAAFGLDIAGSSYQALFPDSHILNPQTCSYQIVDPSFCGSICAGSAEECTPGVKNNLIASLLPPASQNSIGLSTTAPIQQFSNIPNEPSQSSPSVQSFPSVQSSPSIQSAVATQSPSPDTPSIPQSTSSVIITSSSITSQSPGPTITSIIGSSTNILGSESSIQDERPIFASSAISRSWTTSMLIGICFCFLF